MNHVVLARKWRPKKFADLVGQEQTRTILQNILISKKLHHAYLLTGTRGVGKTTIARIIAKALNCLNISGVEPCGTCANCGSIDVGRFVDVIEIDAASNTGVDNVRELIDDAKYAPSTGLYKIYIIDEVHMLSKSAFNAMLKTLEEPPAHAIFILATTDPHKVPITILSRCLQLKLRNLFANEIEERLKYVLAEEKIGFEEAAIPLLAKVSDGSMRDALSLLDQAIAFSPANISVANMTQMLGLSDNELVFNLLDAISTNDSNRLVQIAKNSIAEGTDVENILENMRTQLCEISIMQLNGASDDSLIQKYAKAVSVNDVQLYFEIVNLGLEQLNKTSDKASTFIMILLRMLAFRMGNSNEKANVLTNSNFSSNGVKTHPLKPEEAKAVVVDQDSANKTTPAINLEAKPEEISPSLDVKVTDVSKVEPNLSLKDAKPLEASHEQVPENIEFTQKGIEIDDWFKLIETLKEKLGYLFPLLENARLNSFTHNNLSITIDSRYENVLSMDARNKIIDIFTTHFNTPVNIEFNFAETISDTLKEKTTNEIMQKQLVAENAIQNDVHLSKIIEQFSATIIPGSIKPV